MLNIYYISIPTDCIANQKKINKIKLNCSEMLREPKNGGIYGLKIAERE